MPKPSVVVVGSSNTDMILRVHHIPAPGETLLGGTFSTAPGGKGANQAVGAARAGGKVALVARVGCDPLGDQAIEGFSRDGIDVTHVTRDPRRPSGAALIFVARDGENSIGVASGANGGLSPSDVRKAAAAIRGARVLLLQLETPLPSVSAAAGLAKAAGALVILNPAPARALPDSLLRRVDVLTPNETEAERLTGLRVSELSGARRAAERLIGRGVRSVILTMGKRGSLVATRGAWTHVPAFRVRAVDTTAAGDIFNGALAVAMAEGRPLLDAARFAGAAGALSVTKLGAQPSAPFRAEIDRLLGRG